jgi:hypothetical protein
VLVEGEAFELAEGHGDGEVGGGWGGRVGAGKGGGGGVRRHVRFKRGGNAEGCLEG